jgi:hypothetical protein
VTVSLGVRYDLEIVPIDQTGNYLFSDPGNYPSDRNNVSPRVGASYTLDEAGTAVLRGGYGLYFQKTAYSNFTPFVASGATSRSFTVSFPANNVDAGPSAGRLPTDPMLVGGPTVNRTLLSQLYPSSATQKNNGTVNFDNPDRHLPYSHQASIGVEKQLPGSIAVSADFVHASHRDLYMRQDLNPGIRRTTARTATVDRIDAARFTAAVLELVNLGYFDYNALQTSIHKRFSNHYQFRVSYTYSQGRGIVDAPGATDTINFATVDPVTKITDLHLASREALGSQDRPHILSMDGSVEVPHTHGLQLSGVWQAQSGSPFTLTDSTTDPNQNGSFEEPLPAGTYSGPAGNVNSITVENTGGFNGARGPDFSLASVRASYNFRFGGRQLRAYVDVFNVFNRANYNNPTSDRRDANFLIVRAIRNGGPSRTAQLNLRYSF